MTKLFLFDIEGTTTDINFVHKVLFPYSEKCMEEFILKHQSEADVKDAIERVKETVKQEDNREIGLNEVIETLLKWIRTDRKHGALKEIQGLIWDIGYSKNHYQGHVYEDVKPFFKRILDQDHKIGIYSSGSVHAQKLIFAYSTEGDLTPMIGCYFDTTVGHKREQKSYETIAAEVNRKPSEITFFSDIPEELQAAKAAGMNVIHVLRPGTAPSEFSSIKNFDEVKEL